jgi:hypothetical protein
MAKLSADKKSVTVEWGDTLSAIARDYGNGLTYKQLAQMNNISNPDLIYVGQVIKLSGTASTSTGSTGSTNSNKVTIEHFGLQSGVESKNVLFVTWTWSKDNTENYKVEWSYDTGDKVWFIGSDSSTEYKQSTYTIPSNAKQVRVRIKPISKTYSSNSKTTSYWTAEWSSYKTHTVAAKLPETPSAPSVELEKFKLTASLDNLKDDATHVQFQIVKDDTTVFKTGSAKIVTSSASYSCNVDAGSEYKVRCRTYKGDLYSEWSPYSGNEGTIPSAPGGITALRATSKTAIYVEWDVVKSAETYELEYTTEARYFDGSDQTTSKSGIEQNHFEVSGLESGDEYFFRVRAVNNEGESSWTEIKSIVIGEDPGPPTTWSSSTTVIVGEPLVLYWVHNAKDSSKETFAEVELTVDGVTGIAITVENPYTEDDYEENKTSFYEIDTNKYSEGTKIEWRVRTAGITKVYGDWSVQRTVDIYAPPTLELSVIDGNDNPIDILDRFPVYVSALAGPKTQIPISYHLTVTSNDVYETVDNIGNVKMVNKGEAVYSKYFDITDALMVELSASNIDLENNMSYTVTCTVSMNSGLIAEESTTFVVQWTDVEYAPNAEISIDPDTYVAHIRPYCEEYRVRFYKVNYASGIYTSTTEIVDIAEGIPIESNDEFVYTSSGDQVFSGATVNGVSVFYCTIPETNLVPDVTLSVYRREFNGAFTELATGLENLRSTFITDPHPALDYARYRIVAITNSTGAVSYTDLPGHPVNCNSVIIQWDEEWTNFDPQGEDALVEPAWSGSMLKLPYNIDVSDSHKIDVALVEYIGRSHPISYYGTQLGQSSSWNMLIEKDDKETLYALRRLARWMQDVYVREPSGSGYWASISVSFSQKHLEMTIPVTLDITRVEGGI